MDETLENRVIADETNVRDYDDIYSDVFGHSNGESEIEFQHICECECSQPHDEQEYNESSDTIEQQDIERNEVSEPVEDDADHDVVLFSTRCHLQIQCKFGITMETIRHSS